MMSSSEGDNDIFFDSMDSLIAQDCGFAKQEFGSESYGCRYGYGYEIWVNEPLSVKERRGQFLQTIGLADTSASKIYSKEKMVFLERIKECSGAVSNACSSHTDQLFEKPVLSGCKSASEAEVLLDGLKGRPQHKPDACFEGRVCELSFTAQEHRHRDAEAREEFQDFEMGIKKMKNWWKRFVHFKKDSEGKVRSKLNTGTNRTRKVKVRQNKKRFLEFSGLYTGQQIRAHKGLIWTMKFSPSGLYLASGGEDGVVRIWRIISRDTSSICFTTEDSTASKVKHDNSYPWKKHSSQSFIFLPNKIFQIEEPPLQEFYGHSSDVLDLAWSNSDILLSSSMDKTVRLWQIGCNHCLSVFHHNDYVTCVQFNPVDDKYFISGSIDGKVRIWGICEERVVDWADIRDVISAISYQHDGKGFVVGSVTGACHVYVASGKYFQLEAQILVHGKKRASGTKITGIQFSENNHQRIMITSEDSKICIFNGIELVHKYRALPKSGSQIHGSFTSSGKHIISVGEDSHVYVWNYSDSRNAFSKPRKSEYTCEYFFSSGVTVAIPWSGMNAEQRSSCRNFAQRSSETQNQLEAAPCKISERFSLGSWFSIDGTCRGSTTWPEEKLPRWDLPLARDEYEHQKLYHNDTCFDRGVSETWGLSIVVADCDGTIKTFHNFGLPIRL
ncbi:PREDICTED: WD repeat-containing protein 44-like [Lupinus angustifolius]|uniref:WD repeat-containing protein 44-like n=1 Tax=Lupinus angustifolius TaxID=3871 RepID=UPI00092F32C3|nr:PREDICTED: WD repeat-containing protein 44-like [Lupinus angustifolius]XP_019462814.1 PREDICTED: WD repeat-containing protein 44-like [Lupinus angustifolius]